MKIPRCASFGQALSANVRLFALLLLLSCSSFGQHPLGGTPHRLIAIVPLQGAGTMTDPIRPLFIQSPDEIAQLKAAGQAPIPVMYRMITSDDGKYAIVEFSSPLPRGLKAIRESADARITVFELGSMPLPELEKRIQRVRKDFNLGVFFGAPKGTSLNASPAVAQ